MKCSAPDRSVSARSIAAWAIAIMMFAAIAHAQEYPGKPVRMVAPFAAGGGSDLAARRLAERLNNAWKQPVIIQNIAGAAGNSAAASVAASEADGYTLFFASLPILVTNPVMYDKLPFDADRDFAPVVLVSDTPHILVVSASSGINRLSDLIALAKERPGKLNFASGGQGTSLHLAGELLKSITGINIVHVPYKGAAPAVTALLGDEVQMLFDNGSTALGHIRGGRVRGLAIASRARAAPLPNVPTFDESGIADFHSGVPHGVFVRAGTPAAIVAALNRTMNSIFAEAEYRKQMEATGVNLIGGAPDKLTAYLAEEKKKWLPLIKRLGIKAY
jgi:tripartite-type tricarboxylate transporter receptor subunit TctC